jgi:hypothetical protein
VVVAIVETIVGVTGDATETTELQYVGTAVVYETGGPANESGIDGVGKLD